MVGQLLKVAISASLMLFPVAVHAQETSLPDNVRAIVDAAIATGDDAKIGTVLDLVQSTNPEAAGEIDRIRSEWNKRKAETAEAARIERENSVREAGLFNLWKGEGQLGGFRSTGTTDAVGISAGLDLRRTGLKWTHIVKANADYQRSNGAVSREYYFAAYEPRVQVSPALFAYGLGQFERNELQGYDARYAVSGGIGYQVVDTDSLDLSIKAGPALRHTDFDIGQSETRLGMLAATDFDWKITDGLTLTQDANLVAETGGSATVIIDSRNTTINLVTGLDARVTDRLRSRLAYVVDYDSNPPIGAASTNTTSRITLVYGF